ncbi:MAG: glycosyltransferase family 39 protein [Nitrospirae bacterium]|nr:glycosyltransferase family 39 protein [Nitrospirota bacterium]
MNWGLPDEDHIFTYNLDELTFLMWLRNMDPAKLDFDPNVYSKTHLPIYYTAAVLKVGEVLGLYKIGSSEYYKQHPDELADILLFQRIFFGKIPAICIIIFSFLIGRILIDEKYGVILAGVSGFLPMILAHNNYAVENILVTLLIIVTFYLSLKYYQTERLKYIILAGIFTGLSISTKQTGVLGFIFIAGVLVSKRNQPAQWHFL